MRVKSKRRRYCGGEQRGVPSGQAESPTPKHPRPWPLLSPCNQFHFHALRQNRLPGGCLALLVDLSSSIEREEKGRRVPSPPRALTPSSTSSSSSSREPSNDPYSTPSFRRDNPQHAGHPSSHVEMTWHHGIPDSSVVFLLLLLFSSPSKPSKDCIFKYSPFPTTNFSDDIEDLKQYLLFDYPVSVPSNLNPDEFCLGIWKLHLINRNLKRMIKVSGSSLKRSIEKIKNYTKFVEKCNIDDSCVNFEKTNISQFLEPLPSILDSMAYRMENLRTNRLRGDFRNCTIIQCLPDSYTTPAISNSIQKHETNYSSQPISPGRSYWGLLIPPVPLLCLAFILRLLCRRFQRPRRFQETEMEPMEVL